MCPVTMLARAGLLLCLVVGSRQLSITELLVPNSVRLGERVELTCRIDLGAASAESLFVKWWRTHNSTEEPEQIYQRIGTNNGTPLHHLEEKDNNTIVLVNAQPKDSGKYECEVTLMVDKVAEAREHQDLIVFSPGTGPLLNISTVADGPDEDTEEDVLIECRAEDVAPSPLIVIKIDGVEYINVTEEIVGPNSDGYYYTLGTATLTRADVDGTTVSCELTYNDTRISHEPYVVSLDYSSGVTTTEALEESTVPVNISESLPNQSGDSTAVHASLALLFALSLLTQVPSLF